jgi:hypothetical protein|tara:strand:- start:621 stop:860 length:240 start_codon:yes stop_codon:yes gene_type:complete
MNDKKLNLNPKRLITFERRMINNYKSQIQIAAMNGENDYVMWLTNRMGFNQKILDKKITSMTRWVAKQELLREFSLETI